MLEHFLMNFFFFSIMLTICLAEWRVWISREDSSSAQLDCIAFHFRRKLNPFIALIENRERKKSCEKEKRRIPIRIDDGSVVRSDVISVIFLAASRCFFFGQSRREKKWISMFSVSTADTRWSGKWFESEERREKRVKPFGKGQIGLGDVSLSRTFHLL